MDADDAGLIVHSRHPYNAEPPLDRLRAAFITPQPIFYVRSHGAIPRWMPPAICSASTAWESRHAA